MSNLDEVLVCDGKFEKSLNKLKNDGVLENLYKLDSRDIELFLKIDAVGGDEKLIEWFHSYNESHRRLHKKVEKMRKLWPLSQLLIALDLGLLGVIVTKLEVGIVIKSGLIIMVFIAYNSYTKWVDSRLKKLNNYADGIVYDQESQTDLVIGANKYLEIRDRIYRD